MEGGRAGTQENTVCKSFEPLLLLTILSYLLFLPFCEIRAHEISSRNIPLAFIAKEHSPQGANVPDFSRASQGFLSCDQISELLGNSGFRFSRPEVELLAAGKKLKFSVKLLFLFDRRDNFMF